MESSDKVRFHCPTCARTFRVPVAHAHRAQCPECEKRSAANKGAEQLEREEQRQRLIALRLEEYETAQEQKVEQEQEARKHRADQTVRHMGNPLSTSPAMRSYPFLDLFGRLMFALSLLGCIGGGFMILAGIDSKGPQTLTGGIMLFVSSVCGLTTAQLIAMVINVAGDIEETKKHVATIDQYFRYQSSRENGNHSEASNDDA